MVGGQGSSPKSRIPNPGATTRSTRVRVRYADTDQMGVVYYANYLVWFEVGRTEWLRDAGWNYRDMEEAGDLAPCHRGTLRISPVGALR